MKNSFFERRCRYSIRKLSVGACSLMIGAVLFASPALAEETAVPENSGTNTELVSGESEHPTNEADKQNEGEHARENKLEKAEGVATTSETASPASNEASTTETAEAASAAKPEEKASEVVAETPSAEAKPKFDKETEAKPEATNQGDESKPAAEANKTEKEVQPDVPKNTEKTLKPKEIKFNSWEELLKWEPGAREDDAINRGSVVLASRRTGHLVNEKASKEAKVQALSNTNSKAKDHASVGGEEFKAYAFDYWQYLDSMVFWEGLVPTPDVIDAGHRNGVPVYGTLFFNWSNSIADQEKFAEALKQDADGSFPIARKLVDMAKYYGYDGYFINQETTGDLVEPLGEKMRQFMLYTKEYAAKVNHPIKYSWYDAMTYNYGRYHQDGLGEYNYQFMQKEGDKVPADHFFANFNWDKAKNDYTIATANWIGRNPYDVFAGLELQQGGSYKTKVKWNDILDENGKLRLSLGLFAPDTITSLGKTGEDYHKNEDIFFTGYQGDPTGQKPGDKDWYGIANLVADRTPAVGNTFTTSFNTGHGKKWFVDGKVSKDSEWNYRSVSGVLPTWRWWQKSTGDKLKASYDFEDAYNGGTSLKFAGDLSGATKQDVNLYSTRLKVTDTTKLHVAHKGGKGTKVYVEFATKKDYTYGDEAARKELTVSDNWTTDDFDLSALAGKTIYGIKLYFENDKDLKGYQFNLGQLTISNNQDAPQAPTTVAVAKQVLKNAQEAEAVVQFTGHKDADFYEVYEKDGDAWRLLTGSSATTIYLPKVSRSASATGTSQELKVVAVGKNGLRSEAATTNFEWGMTVQDTSLPRPLAENIVPGATVIGSTFPDTEGGEGIEGMLNGTITSLSDKWSSSQLSGSVDIRLTQPRRVVRWVMDHAGAGGESVNDGLMNTKDFDLYYKDADGQWKLAKEVRGNKAHVTDITLDKPITAQDWRLNVVTSDNGTPWKAIRIYNWKMYEKLDTESVNIPMAKAAARSLGNNKVQVGFADVPAGATITVYDNPNSQTPLATLKSEVGGDLASAPLDLTNQSGLLYYRTQFPGKEISNVLAVSVPKDDRKIKSVSLETGPKKTSYAEGEDLNLRGGVLRVRYEGGAEDELIRLTHAGVSVSGFDTHHKGEQNLTLQYLGQPVNANLSVTVTSQDEASPKTILRIEVSQEPKKDYLVGDSLDLSEGRFAVAYSNDTMEEHSFTDEGVEISGYDAQKTGRQTLTLRYQGHKVNFDVLVSPKAALNDEYLKQKLAEVEAAKNKVVYNFASPEVKEAFLKAIEAAEQVLKDHETSTQDQVNDRLNKLTEAHKALNGQEKFTEEKTELDRLTGEAQELLAAKPNHPSGSALAPLLEKNKALVEKVDLSSEELATAKQSLKDLVALLKEDKPAVFSDSKTGVEVHFSNKEKTVIKGLKVERVQASAEEKKYFAGEDAHVFEIEGLDEKGQDVDLSYASIVKIPIEKDKKVKRVFFLPEGKEAVELAFEQTDSHVIFTAPHFTHYAFVYESAEKPRVESNGANDLVTISTKPEQQNTVLPKTTNQPASDQQKAPKLEVQEEKVAFDRQEHENADMLVGEQRVIIQGRDGLLRHVFEVDENGQRRLRSTEVIQEAIPEIVEIGTKVKTEPAVAPTQEKPAQNTAVKSEEASKQLPNTGTADANEALIAGLASLGLASLALTLKQKKEDED
ncbi:bacterial Ig-like domain-containing protein [Streptococcus sp. 10824]|uniref:endo-beta-N-acetylglucosaminidase n=1 Tax=Streptococcus sp. 10824 TaxID=2582678 RepID=UPI001561DBA7|nr:bacterial Ig-like domain-containing protein [Streptococcus sp. 10824]